VSKKRIYLLSPTQFKNVTSIPAIEFKFIDTEIDLHSINALIFTSKTAVKSIDRLTSLWRNIDSFAVGDKTANYIRELGGKVVKVANGYGDELVNLISEEFENRKFLYIRPEIVAIDLERKLENLGIDIQSQVLYKTYCNRVSSIDENSIVIATSPSTVECLLKTTIPNSTTFVAIGRTTAESIPHRYLKHISDERSIKSCIELAESL
jgi:uroporphyrinogen-III synthase